MPASIAAEPEAFSPHDHRACRGRALAAAALCAERRLRLTPARAFVLERLLASHRAMTAYEILEELAEAGLGSQPPVAYRALDFLVANGLAHRIERLAAFAACTHAEAAHNAGFLICRACRRVAETPLPRPPARSWRRRRRRLHHRADGDGGRGALRPLPRGGRVTPRGRARSRPAAWGSSFGGHRVLEGVDLALGAGEIVTVVGPNGSGKSTLLRLLIGAERPDAGRVIRAPGLRIGYVPQKLAVDATLPMTVDRFLGLAEGDARLRAQALERVGIPDLGGRQLAALSGGQFQRALLAQALLRRPGLLVLDEAAQGLDQPGEARFYRLIEQIRGELGCARADGQPRPARGDGGVGPGDLPQRPRLLRGHAHRGLGGAGISRALRLRHPGGAGALPARPRPRA